MRKLVQFVLPIQGLKPGIQEYQFDIDKSFFDAFEHSLIHEGKLKVEVVVDKQPTLISLEIRSVGTVVTECDRCLDPIELPVEGEEYISIKYSNDPENKEDDDEVIYISPKASELDISKLIYDCISLSLPIRKVCDDVPGKSCNPDALKYIQKASEEDNDGKDDGSVWDKLKGLSLDD